MLSMIGLGVTLDQLWLNDWLFDKSENRTSKQIDLNKTYQLGNVLLEPIGKDSVLVNNSLQLPLDSFKVQIAQLTLRQTRQYSTAKRLIKKGKPLSDSANVYYKEIIGFDLLSFLEQKLTPSVEGIYKVDSEIVRINNQGKGESVSVKPSLFDDELYFDTGQGFKLYMVDTVHTEPGGKGSPVVTEIVYRNEDKTISKLLNL